MLLSHPLARRFLRRLSASAVLLFAVVTAAFVALHALPGDPITLLGGQGAPPEVLDDLRTKFGLDRPLAVQYGRWLAAALRGEWGRSIRLGTPAMDYLLAGLRNTAILALPALALQLVLGVGLGVAAGRRAGSRLDFAVRTGTVLLYALPVFWFAQMSRWLVAERWRVLPSGGMHPPGAAGDWGDTAIHAALPVLVLGLAITAHTARLVRNHLVEIWGEDFVRTARAKGAGPSRVAWVHALRNTLAPVTQSLGLTLALLLSGSIVIETIFAWPGLGRRVYLAVAARDFPVVLAGTALTAGIMIVANALADLLHAAVDPRVRHG